MENNCRRIILDKNIFCGTRDEKLCQFARSHFLILPEVLIYECATTPNKKDPEVTYYEQDSEMVAVL
jgi:hypothetical protein